MERDESQPPVERDSGETRGERPASLRAALYVDGFNLYYPIHEWGPDWCYLKWASLRRLGEIICEPHGASLERVVLCTAVPAHYPDKRDRHNTFNAAQRANGVDIILGHHMHDGEKYNEKQTDINVALSLILDGCDDIYDMAILLSADSDQAATAKFFTERFPHKRLLAVAPPDRPVSDKVKPYAFAAFSLNKHTLERCVMRETVQGKTGLIVRPKEYDPPDWWMHPDDRPKGKAPKAPRVRTH